MVAFELEKILAHDFSMFMPPKIADSEETEDFDDDIEEEYGNASESLKKHNFKVNYIFTHTIPYEMILRFKRYPDPHDMQLTGFLEWIMYEAEYRCWFCGHWHADKELDDKFRILWFDILRIA